MVSIISPDAELLYAQAYCGPIGAQLPTHHSGSRPPALGMPVRWRSPSSLSHACLEQSLCNIHLGGVRDENGLDCWGATAALDLCLGDWKPLLLEHTLVRKGSTALS